MTFRIVFGRVEHWETWIDVVYASLYMTWANFMASALKARRNLRKTMLWRTFDRFVSWRMVYWDCGVLDSHLGRSLGRKLQSWWNSFITLTTADRIVEWTLSMLVVSVFIGFSWKAIKPIPPSYYHFNYFVLCQTISPDPYLRVGTN